MNLYFNLPFPGGRNELGAAMRRGEGRYPEMRTGIRLFLNLTKALRREKIGRPSAHV